MIDRVGTRAEAAVAEQSNTCSPRLSEVVPGWWRLSEDVRRRPTRFGEGDGAALSVCDVALVQWAGHDETMFVGISRRAISDEEKQ